MLQTKFPTNLSELGFTFNFNATPLAHRTAQHWHFHEMYWYNPTQQYFVETELAQFLYFLILRPEKTITL